MKQKEHVGVSKNRGTPKSSILIGFSTIFTIHFGGKIPLFLETPMYQFNARQYTSLIHFVNTEATQIGACDNTHLRQDAKFMTTLFSWTIVLSCFFHNNLTAINGLSEGPPTYGFDLLWCSPVVIPCLKFQSSRVWLRDLPGQQNVCTSNVLMYRDGDFFGWSYC